MPRLIVLGGLSIETGNGLLAGRAVQRRRLALMALLAAARAGGMSRDKLIAYLWPEADAENGRRYLSDSVYRINQALDGDAIVATGDELRLDPRRLQSDVGEFEDAMGRGDHERAVGLYAGPFLDGFHLTDAPELERWVDGERARRAAEYARALEALAEAAERDGDHAASARWWRRLAAHDPYNSRVALRLMHALRAAGERAAAIQHARVHQSLLRQELEMEPDPTVVELAERLRAEARRDDGSPSPIQDGPGAAGHADPVAEPPPPPPPLALDAAPPRGARRLPSRRAARAWLAWSTVGLLAFALVVLEVRGTSPRERSPAASPRAIAVLPFANLSADSANEYFSDGMTEELIATLGRVQGLRVASRTSAFAYKGRAVDVRDIGRALGVDAVVEGSVRKAGRTLRITVQLVSTADGYRLWSDTYDRELEDVFAIQEEISRAITARLTGTLVDGRQLATADREVRDPEAYDLYLRGRFAWHQRTPQGLARAIEFFQQATTRAPGYARAHAGLADAYAVAAFYDYLAPREAYPKAEAAARRALAIDPGFAAPHATLGYVLTYYHLDWPRAEAEFRRALAIDPAYSTAHQWYANLLTASGRFEEAERQMRLAQEADPLSLIANAALGWIYYHTGRYDDALEQCRRTLALDPDYQLAHLWEGWALEALGRRAEAREPIQRAVALSRGSDLARLSLAHLLAGSTSEAERDSARAIVREIEARAARGDYVPSYEIAKIHLALRDRASALRWLERAIEERSHSRAFLRVDPQWAPLRGEPRFEELVVRALGPITPDGMGGAG